jgi:hypothetical protein
MKKMPMKGMKGVTVQLRTKKRKEESERDYGRPKKRRVEKKKGVMKREGPRVTVQWTIHCCHFPRFQSASQWRRKEKRTNSKARLGKKKARWSLQL